MRESVADEDLARDLKAAVRDVPDFPRPGILFRDITPLLADATLFARATAAMAAPFAAARVSHVVAIESRGFILGGPIAVALAAGFVPVRKAGKLPAARSAIDYALEYGSDRLEIHAGAVGAGDRVLVVDDVLATGGTASAACRLVEAEGATVVGCSVLAVLTALSGARAVAPWALERLIDY